MTDAKPVELIPVDLEELKKQVIRDALNDKVIACPYDTNCRFIDKARREERERMIKLIDDFEFNPIEKEELKELLSVEGGGD
ncbi:MAG: hypothetical protein WC307_07030 [Candidatus Nanoarchaeia archaeon]